jgi:molybdopterin-guanine dinucleotide biosynthesis protein A
MSPRIAAAILAGGKGERLGGTVKANITIGGIRLLERVSSALGDADVTLVSIGGFPAAELAILPGQIAVPDLLSDYRGPLAGVAAAVDWCLRQPTLPDLLATAAVDTPFLPADFISRMLTALPDGAPAVIATAGGQDYPTNALWRVAALTGLPAGMLSGTAPRSLRRLAAALGAVSLEWPCAGNADPFANVNTPDDLATLEARAARNN